MYFGSLFLSFLAISYAATHIHIIISDVLTKDVLRHPFWNGSVARHRSPPVIPFSSLYFFLLYVYRPLCLFCGLVRFLPEATQLPIREVSATVPKPASKPEKKSDNKRSLPITPFNIPYMAVTFLSKNMTTDLIWQPFHADQWHIRWFAFRLIKISRNRVEVVYAIATIGPMKRQCELRTPRPHGSVFTEAHIRAGMRVKCYKCKAELTGFEEDRVCSFNFSQVSAKYIFLKLPPDGAIAENRPYTHYMYFFIIIDDFLS